MGAPRSVGQPGVIRRGACAARCPPLDAVEGRAARALPVPRGEFRRTRTVPRPTASQGSGTHRSGPRPQPALVPVTPVEEEPRISASACFMSSYRPDPTTSSQRASTSAKNAVPTVAAAVPRSA